MISAIIGTSTVIRHVQHLVLKVAESDAPVLITGESGTGKELVARAIHEKSARAVGPFVPIKCAAISEDVLEAELFGHEAGAFPGAHQAREGRFEIAAGGTLFLDEVSKLSPKMQARLAKVMQEGVIEPLGGTRTVTVNVRIICSTTVNLEQLVRDRIFREDLYYRLASCAIYIPPISERREDIPPLVDHFINKFNQAKGKRVYAVSPDALSALIQYTWPNNVREIENLVERIVILKNTGSIEVSDLPPRIRNLVTDNIDSFYEKASLQRAQPQPQPTQPTRGNTMSNGSSFRGNGMGSHFMGQPKSNPSYTPSYSNVSSTGFGSNPSSGFDEASEIEQFIRKEIDLGSGIDFYRVVEEFENKLIAEALRRTSHNKNRAAQLLSMNRTTLVEKLKKRQASNPVKAETGRVKRNSAFTIFDGLGNDNNQFEPIDYMSRGLNTDNRDRDID